jgi:CHRD domain
MTRTSPGCSANAFSSPSLPWRSLGMLALAALAGCNTLSPPAGPAAPAAQAPAAPAPASRDSNVALSTQLRAANEVPVNSSAATGNVDAVFNRDTGLLRWKVSYTGLSGPATAGHFHGPAGVGANAGVALGWPVPITSGMEGRATLTQAQSADLLAGKWYANIHTAANPGGEIRGQMTVRN